jgi:hypothetical protein
MEKTGQVDILLRWQADPNIGRIDGLRPLHVAVLKNNLALVQSLLNSGADPNMKTNIFQQTPLHFAIKNNIDPDILLLLVGHNGSLHMRDHLGKKPIDYAETNEMKEALNKLKTQKEEVFITPQKERMISIYSNSVNNAANFELKSTNNKNLSTLTKDFNTNLEFMRDNQAFNNENFNQANFSHSRNEHINSNNILNSNLSTFNGDFNGSFNNQSPYRSPLKTTNYIVKKLIIKTASDNKFSTRKSKNKTKSPRLDENLPRNRSFSPSDYDRSDTQGNNFTLDHKFSFITRDHSKINSPDGKISDLNPLDTLYSNCNTANNLILTTNGLKDSKGQVEDHSRTMQYINSEHTGVQISEGENSKVDIYLEELNINEENTSRNCYDEEIEEEENEDDLQYSPSRRSLRISDVGQDTSRNKDIFSSEKKNNVNRKLDFETQIINNSNKSSKTKKLKYHKEKREKTNVNHCQSLKKERKTITLNTCHKSEKNNINAHYINTNPNIYYPRIRTETSPEHGKSNFTETPEDNNNKHSLKECGNCSNCGNYVPSHTHSHTTLYHPSSKVQTGHNSTRNTSVIYLPDDKLQRKRFYLNEAVNPHDLSNKTIIHCGTVESTGNYATCCRDCPTHHNIASNNSKKKESTISELSHKNSPYVETIYPACETNRSNPSVVDTKKLLDWLSSIGLLDYYDNFLDKEHLTIERLVKCMANPETRLTFQDVESMGIRKPGHIFKIIVKLEVDAKLINSSYYEFLVVDNYNNLINPIHISQGNLRFSIEKNVCCGGLSHPYSNEDGIRGYELISWLKKINLPHLRKNFIHNGFESIGFFILQMFSNYPITEDILENFLHIYCKKDRRNIMNELAKEVKTINRKLFNNSQKDLDIFKLSSSLKLEKNTVEEGCKMCHIY